MKSAILLNCALAAYLLGVIWTFGHAANSPRDCERKFYSTEWLNSYAKLQCESNSNGENFIKGLGWPFYWSVQLQKGEAQ